MFKLSIVDNKKYIPSRNNIPNYNKHEYIWHKPNYEPFDKNDYIVYCNGQIYSKRRQRFLKHSIDKKGYAKVRYCGKVKFVHQIVAEKYIPNPNNYTVINHKDKNPLNNKVTNLEWCTTKYNVRYSKAKKVYCYDASYKCVDIKECTKDFKNIGFRHVSECASGKIHVCNGLVFSYIALDESAVIKQYSKSPSEPEFYNDVLKKLKHNS